MDRVQNQYDDLVETIFEEYDRQQSEKLNKELNKDGEQ